MSTLLTLNCGCDRKSPHPKPLQASILKACRGAKNKINKQDIKEQERTYQIT